LTKFRIDLTIAVNQSVFTPAELWLEKCSCFLCYFSLQHVDRLYNPPYSRRTSFSWTWGLLFGGIGVLTYMICHQQKKNGFWFKKEANPAVM